MKLNEVFLTELGNAPYPYYANIGDDYTEVLTDNGLAVYFSTYPSRRNRFRNTIIIEFTVNGQAKITGGGDAVRILSTVKSILSKYLPKGITPKVDTVTFGADKSEPSRVKLYRRAAPIISQILGNEWVFNEGPESDASLHEFTWTRRLTESETESEKQLGLFSDNKIYYLMIDGKIWKRAGKPVEFVGYQSADSAALSIIRNKGKPAQVVDPDRYPVN